MTRLKFSIIIVGGLWEVRYGNRREPDLTDAVRQAIGEKKSLDTQWKAARFIRAFLNFVHRLNEPWDAFIAESVTMGRMRIEAHLMSEGFEVIYETNRIDGSSYVRGIGDKSVTALPVGLAALARLYGALHRKGLRPKANPMRIDGWHRLLAPERMELARMVMGPKAKFNRYQGSQYIASGLAPSPLRIEDPTGLGPKLLDAGRVANWPPSILDLVTVLTEDGPRWSCASPLNAADWGRSSGFGRTLWAPNKTSGGRRVKHIVITASTVLQLRKSFDDDLARPSMVELERMLAAGDWNGLEKVFLFPSKRGTPHSYNVYNNDYVRPAVEAAGLLIHSKIGSTRPTGHRLRAARIQAEVDHIHRAGRTQKQIDNDVEQLRRDMHIANRQAFERYLGEKREELALTARIVRFDESRRRDAAARAAGSAPPPRSARTKSRAELRQEALACNGK